MRCILLKPAGLELVVRVMLSLGWHPRHITGLVRSRYERNYKWGDIWYHYDATTRADFYTRMKDLLTRKALPLFGIALSFGATASVYLSFSVDLVVQSGGLPGISAKAVGPALFACYGLTGIVGMFTGDLEKKLGITIQLRIIFLLSTFSLALLGFATGDWFALIISSSLQGICVMTVSAILAFWSLRVFPFTPAVSFTAVLLFLAAGNMVGPVLASLLAGRFGMETAFLACAAFSLLTALLIRRKQASRPNLSPGE